MRPLSRTVTTRPLLEVAASCSAKLKHFWANANCRGQLAAWIKAPLGWSMEAVLPLRLRGCYPEDVEPLLPAFTVL